MSGCAPITDLGLIRDVLTAVDCNTRGFARLGYDALTLAGSPFQTALTLLLTVYVAVTGYRLFFATGGVHLSDGPGIILKIGTILTLVTSWSVFQTLVFDMASRAPVEIAHAITIPLRSGGALTADPLAGLQAAYDQLSAASTLFAKAAKTASNGDSATAAQALGMAANILFVASAGLIAVLTVAIGVLTAIGPFFVALFLFPQTRGFFTGWVRALAAAALGLLAAWTVSILTLHVLEPWLSALSDTGMAAAPDAQVGITASVIVFIFAASQAGLLLAGVMIARGFRLNFIRTSVPATQNRTETAAAAPTPTRAMLLAEQLRAHTQTYSGYGRIAAAPMTAYARRTEAPVGTAKHLGDLYRRPAIARPNRAREA